MTASMSPIPNAALSTWNAGTTSISAESSPLPSSPSMADSGTTAPLAVTGVEPVPRSPRPSKPDDWLIPSVLLGTYHRVIGPSAASGLLDHTQPSALAADV